MVLVEKPAEHFVSPVGLLESPPAEVADTGLTVVVPAYNEEAGIGPTLKKLLRTLECFEGTVATEVIVVDDGSTDETRARVEALPGDRVRLLRHDENLGYGAALKTGIRHARYNWILITDADGTYVGDSIPGLLAHRRCHDMVVGARTGPNAAIPWIRRPAKWVLRRLASYLVRRKIPDLNSGLRLIRKDVVERFEHLLPDGFSFTTTITLATMSSGHRVKYVPIEYRKRTGRSKIRPLADTLNFVMLIFRTIMYFNPLRVFLPVAAAFVASSIAVGFVSTVFFGRLMDVTTVLLFVTGIQCLMLGLIADSLSRRIR